LNEMSVLTPVARPVPLCNTCQPCVDGSGLCGDTDTGCLAPSILPGDKIGGMFVKSGQCGGGDADIPVLSLLEGRGSRKCSAEGGSRE
jgi:hypothetical protein